jgi:histidinol-phosphate phosphatase family protein
MRPCVFLDRDGVVNQAPPRGRYIARPADFHLLPGAADLIRLCNALSVPVIVVTNQRGVALGEMTEEQLGQVHDHMRSELAALGARIDDVYACVHGEGACDCRKPRPGMVLAAAEKWDIDLGRSVMVGDSERDRDLARAAGLRFLGVGGLGPNPDDWDAHWGRFGEAAASSPAAAYRMRLILDRLARAGCGPGSRILDIGSGQGEVAEALLARFPGARVLGVELSAAGVAAASRRVPGAEFVQRDLLVPRPPSDYHATHAVCSEVLEHLEDPATLLRNAAGFMAPGCALVATVPGGPMSAFDRHIGHRRHFSPASLASVLEAAGFGVESSDGAGFPFFNLYRLAVNLRGERLVADVSGPPSWAARLAMSAFRALFRLNLDSGRPGWQNVAVARLRGPGPH